MPVNATCEENCRFLPHHAGACEPWPSWARALREEWLHEGMVVGAAIIAWADVLRKRERNRCTVCGKTGQPVGYDPRTMCLNDVDECERLGELSER